MNNNAIRCIWVISLLVEYLPRTTDVGLSYVKKIKRPNKVLSPRRDLFDVKTKASQVSMLTGRFPYTLLGVYLETNKPSIDVSIFYHCNCHLLSLHCMPPYQHTHQVQKQILVSSWLSEPNKIKIGHHLHSQYVQRFDPKRYFEYVIWHIKVQVIKFQVVYKPVHLVKHPWWKSWHPHGISQFRHDSQWNIQESPVQRICGYVYEREKQHRES